MLDVGGSNEAVSLFTSQFSFGLRSSLVVLSVKAKRFDKRLSTGFRIPQTSSCPLFSQVARTFDVFNLPFSIQIQFHYWIMH